MSNLRTAIVAAATVLLTAPGALAASGTLQLIIGGEAYDGPPRFEVSFDGKPLGEAPVTAAIDTASAGRFADAADKTQYVQSFSFDIPAAIFKPGGEVRIRLVNEAYGGDGSNRDRNLYLAAVAVNGKAVTVSGLSTDGGKPELLGEFLVLRDGNVEGVSHAPVGGWPPTDTTIAEAPTAVETKVATISETPATKPPVAVTALKIPAVSPPVEVKAASASAASASSCSRDELYNVIGFNENSNDVTPRLAARLDQIIADIGAQKCRVTVTGYSSKQGNHATNALFAIERAQNVLAYLRANGLVYEKAIATGGGATEQFGASFSANRRVVIAISP